MDKKPHNRSSSWALAQSLHKTMQPPFMTLTSVHLLPLERIFMMDNLMQHNPKAKSSGSVHDDCWWLVGVLEEFCKMSEKVCRVCRFKARVIDAWSQHLQSRQLVMDILFPSQFSFCASQALEMYLDTCSGALLMTENIWSSKYRSNNRTDDNFKRIAQMQLSSSQQCSLGFSNCGLNTTGVTLGSLLVEFIFYQVFTS